ncbi:MAG: dehydrogenase E1 component subunit alpha/beta [Planctomycetes bacterium]|nr:dehydrogenase E1 component subunit alpha/beta [Planctomycetota bacterium]
MTAKKKTAAKKDTMATATLPATRLSKELHLRCYRTMVLSRTLDEKCALLLKQSKGGTFQIVGPGQEAAQAAASLVFRAGVDWSYCHYRDQCYNIGLGVSPEEILLSFLAREGDPASGGRQMPSHFGHAALRIVSKSSCVGTQYLQAAGRGLACKYEGKGEVAYCSSGEGTTSQGEFYEALNFAALHKCPTVFFVQDNEYAISTHRSEETASASIYDQVAGFRGLHRIRCNGLNIEQTYNAIKEAHERASRGDGPTLVVADVVRLWAHSSSDNAALYRSKEEIANLDKRDPIKLEEAFLIEHDFATRDELDAIKAEIKQQVDRAGNWVEEQPFSKDALSHVFFEGPQPITSPGPAPKTEGEPQVMIDMINRAMHEEMRRNDKIVVFGQDVAKGKGGVFTATKGLTEKFGIERCFNSPLAEATIAGIACGLAHGGGWKPLIEIQFGDYIFPAIQQIVNEIATCRYRSNNAWANPMVIRVPVGGYIQGGMYHSQSIDSLFAHRPGLRVAIPSRADDAKGLLKAALRSEDPVLFMEPKFLYRQARAKAPDPGEDYTLEFGKLRVVLPGRDVTLVTWGNTVLKAIDAAKEIEKSLGASVEILDLRTLNPWDKDGILESVAKTNRCVVLHEDFLTGGFGAEISARIMEEAFEMLDAPVLRVAAKDVYCPYGAALEEQVLPQTAWVVEALTRTLQY